MSDKDIRLQKLIEHWIGHNEEHRVRFEEATSEALETGLVKVAENLESAAKMAGEVSKFLRRALEAF
jgi:hypothetical protein